MTNANNDYGRLIGAQMTPIQMLDEIERLRTDNANLAAEVHRLRNLYKAAAEQSERLGAVNNRQSQLEADLAAAREELRKALADAPR